MSDLRVFYYINNEKDAKCFIRLTKPYTTFGDFKRALMKSLHVGDIFSYHFNVENDQDGYDIQSFFNMTNSSFFKF